MICIANREIKKIALIDDNLGVRTSYAELVEDMGVEPVVVGGPLRDVRELFAGPLAECDAVISDLALKGSGYAPYDGGEIAAEGHRRKVPVLICTAYANYMKKLGRSHRRWTPAVLPRAQVNSALLFEGLAKCIHSLNAPVRPDQRTWRTQVEVTDVDFDRKQVWFRVMGRSPDEKVDVDFEEIPAEMVRTLKEGSILHARVNTGAKSPDDLFFEKWEHK